MNQLNVKVKQNFSQFANFVKKEYAENICYPKRKQIFSAF